MYANTIIGKFRSASTGPDQVITRIGPLSSVASPSMKCAKTKRMRYAIEVKAMIDVYLSESRRRRKEIGMTINLQSVSPCLGHFSRRLLN